MWIASIPGALPFFKDLMEFTTSLTVGVFKLIFRSLEAGGVATYLASWSWSVSSIRPTYTWRLSNIFEVFSPVILLSWGAHPYQGCHTTWQSLASWSAKVVGDPFFFIYSLILQGSPAALQKPSLMVYIFYITG